MTRMLALCLVLGGIFVLVMQPGGASASHRRAEMLPPTDNLGNLSFVSCWYHTACPPYGSYGGTAIDWLAGEQSSDHNVWQRFYVWPQDPNYYVKTHLSSNKESIAGCDYYDLFIHDGAIPGIQGFVRYFHAETDWEGAWTIEYPGQIANWLDGSMTDDSDGCAWDGFHVHEESSGQEWLNPVYTYNGTPCDPGYNYRRECFNDDHTNVTRAFIW
jgi:hypothetical protein